MKTDEELTKSIHNGLWSTFSNADGNPTVYVEKATKVLLKIIHDERRAAVDEFQERLDEKEFTLGGDTTTPAIVYQWMQDVSDDMFPSQG